MDEILVANSMTFLDVVETERYDLVVGDESWDVDHFLHEDPSAKHARFARLTDFVGYVPMPEGGERERLLTADHNAEMLEHVERHPGVRDLSVFVGDPDDVVDLPFGPGLPGIREWTEAHYRFAGHITGFDPSEVGDREALRAEFGYAPDETVIIAAVGGSGVGASLLRRVIRAQPLIAENVPDPRTVVVTGPRLDPAALPDASVDEVICSLVLCTVTDPRQVLEEVRRVLRPGGRFRFVEHVAAPPGSFRSRVQQAIRRPWGWLFEGCDPHRHTVDIVREAGFATLRVRERKFRRSPFWPVNTAVWGIATR